MVPEFEIERHKMTYLIEVNLTLGFLLKKLQESLVKAHPEIKIIAVPKEVECEMDEDVQTEAEKGNVANTRPIEAEINHTMRWLQDGRKVCLQG